MTRPYVFGTNFKMNQTPPESAAFYRQLAASISIPPEARVFIFPPFTSLAAVTEAAEGGPANLWVGAQNVHWAADGAYTGEISLRMLQDLGVDIVLLGHAERRQIFLERDVDLNKKVRAVLDAGLRILFGIGETAEERGYGVSNETILRQLKIGLHGVEASQLERVNIAYEPVWSIGAGGTPATPADVEPIAATVRAALGELFGAAGSAVPILYGGSVDPKNAGTFTGLPNVDGLLVGRAGWAVESFVATFESGLAGYLGKA
ncbi:MAG: triose-phosphate isomerase [Thermomicrobiales bacterium]|nr:triose-phosphate isomerase [Thermomicrobiales bacterium]